MFAPAANASHASHGTLPEVVIEDLQLGEGIEALPFSTVAWDRCTYVIDLYMALGGLFDS
jgi:hypothetical protein